LAKGVGGGEELGDTSPIKQGASIKKLTPTRPKLQEEEGQKKPTTQGQID